MHYTDPKPAFTLVKVGKDKGKRIWFVSFMFTDEGSGERKQFQFRARINQKTTEGEKITEANSTAAALLDYLREGWNPFTESPGQYQNRSTGGFVNRPRTLGEALKECYDIKMQQLTGYESERTYKYIYNHFSAWVNAQFLDRLRPDSFTTAHAMAYSDHLTNQGKKGRGFNNYRTVVKIFFNMMVERDLIQKNPFSKIKPARTTEAEITPFADMELQAIRSYLIKNDYNLYVFTQMIFYLLLRPIEIVKLQVKHIDLTRNKITLPSSASKNRKSRLCNIPPALKTILQEWLRFESVNDYLFGFGMATGPRPIARRNTVTERHAKALKAMGFEGKLSLYSYKYNGVIAAHLAGISMEEIRLQAGHHSVEITQIYMVKLGLLKPSSFGTVNY